MRFPRNEVVRRGFVLLSLCCFAVPLTESSHGQATESAASAATQQGTEYSLSVEAPLVVVDVLVTDKDGTVLNGLKKENF